MSQNTSSSTMPRITSSVMTPGLIGSDLRKERCRTCRRRPVFAGSLYGIGPLKCYGTRAPSDSVWRPFQGAGGQTPAQPRRGLRLQKLPASFVVPTERRPLAEGRVTFLCRVSTAGTVTVLSQTFRVGRRHRGLYLRLVIDTGRGWLTAYLN